MTCENIIKNAGLKIVKKHIGKFHDTIIETDYKAKDSTISKYYIYNISLQNFEYICESEKTYKEFEIEYIEPIFMDIDGDLSWNLYLVFVMSDEDYFSLSDEKRTTAESSKEYTRKLVISESKFKACIPVGKLKKADSNIELKDPLKDWSNALQKENLDFCLDKVSNSNIKEYLKGNIIESSLKSIVALDEHDYQDNVSNESIKIKELKIGTNFRSHCFSPTAEFSFSNVNIFEGANGSGKTSVLEAIELAFTGEIQRDRMGNERSEKKESVDRITFDNGESFTNILSPMEKKNRESKFYQNREKRIDKLNQAFHQYNYFSSEEVYKFCFKEQPDFDAAFSRVIFGEEMGSIEYNWQQYKKLFSREKDDIERDINTINTHIKLLSSNVENKRDAVLTSMEIFVNLLDKLGFIYEYHDETDLQRLLQWGKNIQMRLIELQNSTIFFSNLKDFNLLHANDFEKRISEFENKQNHFSQQKNELLMAINDENIRNISLIGKLEDTEKIYKNVVKQRDYIKNINDKYIRYIKIYSDKSKITEREQLEIKHNLLKNEQKVIGFVTKNWWSKIKSGLPSKTKQNLLEQKAYCEKEISECQNKLTMNEIKQTAVKSKKDFLENIISEIKVLGEQYIKEKPTANKCPLCGANYATVDCLKKKMQNEISGDKDDLGTLFSEQKKLMKYLADNNVTLNSIINDLEIYRALNSAAQYILEHQHECYGIRLVRQSTIKEYYDNIVLLTNNRDEIKSLLCQTDEKILCLEDEGFTLENIQQANQFFSSEDISSIEPNINISDIRPVISKKIMAINSQLNELEARIKEYRSEKDGSDVALVGLNEKIELVSKDIETIQLNIRQIKQWNCVIEKIIDKESSSLKTYSFQDWSAFLKRSIVENENLQKVVNENILLQSNQKELFDYQKKLIQLKEENHRCKNAINILDSLQPLSKYTSEFLNKNVNVINDLFLTLHIPNEFENLGISKNRLFAYRKNSSEKCDVNQMSAGQRTALVLSVFFSLHLSLPSVPNFVLLDEPVANLDDLNLLGLLDFLRQLYLTKQTQIFFTTANPLVASLFRRKFSYLSDDFNLYSFRRNGDKTTKIISYQYNPNEEDGKQMSVVS